MNQTLINPQEYIGQDLKILSDEVRKAIVDQKQSLNEGLGYRLVMKVIALNTMLSDPQLFAEELSSTDWIFTSGSIKKEIDS